MKIQKVDFSCTIHQIWFGIMWAREGRWSEAEGDYWEWDVMISIIPMFPIRLIWWSKF